MEGPDDVRLPELEIFRKYSLALRQEFATQDELLAALETTYRQAGGVSSLGAKPSRRAAEEAAPGRTADLETQLFQAVGASEPPDEDVDSYLKEALTQVSGGSVGRPPSPAPGARRPSAVPSNGTKAAPELPDGDFWGDGPKKGTRKKVKGRTGKTAAAAKARSGRSKTIRVGPDGNPEFPDSD